MRPPYLIQPPGVIPIDVGRQLFVDDFLIEQSTLRRVFHRAQYVVENPIVRPTTVWERADPYSERIKASPRPTAMPFSDAVIFDPADHLFKMWYMAGYGGVTCLALSDDGIVWRKPAFDVMVGTNIVNMQARDSSTIWLDYDDPNPRLRYKMSLTHENCQTRYCSPDGVHWQPAGYTGPAGDRTTVFYNPFRHVWVFSIRDTQGGRYRRYYETSDFFAARWAADEPVPWVAADALDVPSAPFGTEPQLYNLDCVAYESVLLGLFSIFRGENTTRHKVNEIALGFSRDGFHWSRPSRTSFLGVSNRDFAWNWTNVQSAGGCCLIAGDRVYFYVSGRSGEPHTNSPGTCSTGLATLRRDGFASLDHSLAGVGGASASVTTRPVTFSGGHVFVNVDTPTGTLRVELLDRGGRVIPGFAAGACVPIRGDHTRARVVWQRRDDVSELAGQAVRFRFILQHGRLYSFWVGRSAKGESDGYVAGGGPGFNGPTDRSGV